MEDKQIGWTIIGMLFGVVSYFLRVVHKDTKDGLKEMESKITALDVRQTQLDTKQAEQEKQVQREISSIKELIELRFTSMEGFIKRIDSNVEKLSNKR